MIFRRRFILILEKTTYINWRRSKPAPNYLDLETRFLRCWEVIFQNESLSKSLKRKLFLAKNQAILLQQ